MATNNADNRSFAEWKSRSGEDAHSMVSDPLFTNAANGVSTLTADSPCKDAGMDAGLGLSYSGLGYDIGYDECTAGARKRFDAGPPMTNTAYGPSNDITVNGTEYLGTRGLTP